jgi:hypothetical protein
MELTTLIAIVLGGLVLLYFGHKGFQQLVRIKANKAIDSGTTPLEKEEDEYKRLLALLPEQRDKVTSVMATASQAAGDLKKANQAVEDAEREYNNGEDLKASEATLDALATAWDDAKKNAAELATIATEADAAQDEAVAALEETTRSLEKFSRQLERDKSKVQLAGALRIASQARQQARDMKSALSAASQASRQVDFDLEKARAENKLSKGSDAEQEMEQLKAKSTAMSAREALKAKRAGNAGGTPPTTPPQA